MARVQLLPPNLVNKIAAGEVVVRPASLVKELVENSLDAGATRVDVEIDNNCRDVVVSDDGRGMDRDDAETALLRHATSKIASLDDLASVRTAGFRGEAVPAIASVTRFRLLTRPAAAEAGTLVEVEGGETRSIQPSAAPPGTRIEARDLFFNVPARRKFLKSSASELNQIVQIVVRLALAHPDVGFALKANGKQRLNCKPCANVAERYAQAMGRKYEGDALLPLSSDWTRPADREADDDNARRDGQYAIRGAIGRPALAGRDRSALFLFANGRPIRHARLGYAIAEAGRGFVMSGRHPVGAIFVESPDGELDVNVHPTKEEVRFAREDVVCGLAYRAVKAAYEAADLTPEARLGEGWEVADDEAPPRVPPPPQPDFLEAATGERRRAEPARLDPEKLRAFRDIWFNEEPPPSPPPGHPANASSNPPPSSRDRDRERSGGRPAEARRAFPSAAFDPSDQSISRPLALREARMSDRPSSAESRDGERAVPPPPPAPRSEMEERALDVESSFFHGAPPIVIGQVGRNYIVAECGDDALVVDQHAAHERLLFHRFASRDASRGLQQLAVPIVIDLPAPAAALLDDLIEPLRELGLAVEPFGGQTCQIVGVPADLPNLDAAALLLDLLADFEREGTPRQWSDLRHRVCATMACKAAVKAGQRLSMPEMERLFRDMRAARLPFTCPHGRPTMIRLTRGELDAQFKRR